MPARHVRWCVSSPRWTNPETQPCCESGSCPTATTREPTHLTWRCWDSNPGPVAFPRGALCNRRYRPSPRRYRRNYRDCASSSSHLAPHPGLEPGTSSLTGNHSAIELVRNTEFPRKHLLQSILPGDSRGLQPTCMRTHQWAITPWLPWDLNPHWSGSKPDASTNWAREPYSTEWRSNRCC